MDLDVAMRPDTRDIARRLFSDKVVEAVAVMEIPPDPACSCDGGGGGSSCCCILGGGLSSSNDETDDTMELAAGIIAPFIM